MSGTSFRERLGPLVERDYRLFFSAVTVTTLGDAVSGIALSFAILNLTHGSVKDVGIVLAVRQVANGLMVLVGGVIADRWPRQLVLVGASLIQGVAQAATAAVVLDGVATIPLLVVLQAVYGAGDGFVIPAETGLVPQTVSPARLQQGNAFLGLTRNFVFILGPALGGALIVGGSPGIALAVDAASFVGAALLLARIRIPPRDALDTFRFFHELREGWREFTSRTWLWSTVMVFGVGNIFFMFWAVLGPAIERAKHGEHGGAEAWALILTVNGVGAVVGGLIAIRTRPKLPLVACILWPALYTLQLAALALHAPVAVVAGAAFFAGLAIAVHLTLWFTVFQREIPEHARSRVSSYDTLGSFVLTPIGLALAGFVAAAIGTSNALWLAIAVILLGNTSMLLIPSVWRIRQPEPTTLAA